MGSEMRDTTEAEEPKDDQSYVVPRRLKQIAVWAAGCSSSVSSRSHSSFSVSSSHPRTRNRGHYFLTNRILAALPRVRSLSHVPAYHVEWPFSLSIHVLSGCDSYEVTGFNGRCDTAESFVPRPTKTSSKDIQGSPPAASALRHASPAQSRSVQDSKVCRRSS
jgi:hypothetical protein